MNALKYENRVRAGFVRIITGSVDGPLRKDDHLDIIKVEEFLDQLIAISS